MNTALGRKVSISQRVADGWTLLWTATRAEKGWHARVRIFLGNTDVVELKVEPYRDDLHRTLGIALAETRAQLYRHQAIGPLLAEHPSLAALIEQVFESRHLATDLYEKFIEGLSFSSPESPTT